MYSPKIDQHTPNLYRLAQAVGKPMTKVADELLSFSLSNLQSIYELDDEELAEIFQKQKAKSRK